MDKGFQKLIELQFSRVGGSLLSKYYIQGDIDTNELIRKCQTIVLKEEWEDTVTLMGRMKKTAGGGLERNCKD